MEKFKFELGCKVTDNITGFMGTVVARADYLHSSNSYRVQPDNHDLPADEIKKAEWLDEGRLSLIN